jgi:hypothetical protein
MPPAGSDRKQTIIKESSVKALPILICTALAGTLAACGSMTSLTDKAEKSAAASSGNGDEARLTDAAAAEATDAATADAQTNDAAGDEVTADAGTNLPTFMDAVKAARDYTRQLLGIDDSALKTYKAAIEATRALATSPEDFKDKIASAHKDFVAAMEAQRTQSEALRVTHADELKAIFEGTVQVFVACGTNVSIGEHQSAGPGQDAPQGGQASGSDDRGPAMSGLAGMFGSDGRPLRPEVTNRSPGQPDVGANLADSGPANMSSGSDERGPRLVFGNGEFKGNLKEMCSHIGEKSVSESAACQDAVAALTALLPAPAATASDTSSSGSGSAE